MYINDEIARRNLELVRECIARGEGSWGRPNLGLDVAAFTRFREGRTSHFPEPYGRDPAFSLVVDRIRGKRVLCLAGGGGEQSALYSLAGAGVTVLDLTPEQLEADRTAARHYGYEVETIQGDIRDLSGLPSACFDLVHEPISTLYVPDLREVYKGVARVLKPGGLYYVDFAVPLLYMAEDLGEDDSGYLLRISQPYSSGPILETKEGKLNFEAGESFGEFHHLLSDIVNGLAREGFILRGLWENPRPDCVLPSGERLNEGRERHRYLPFGLTVVSEGRGPVTTE